MLLFLSYRMSNQAQNRLGSLPLRKNGDAEAASKLMTEWNLVIAMLLVERGSRKKGCIVL
eukprot:2398074-Amphidinium_carterae.3